jgi:hypothetical protein
MIGYQSIDMDAVNVRMAGAGLPDFSHDFVTVGAAKFATVGSFMIGATAHYVLSVEEPSGALETEVDGGQIQLDVGYGAYSTRTFSFYPMVGVGGGLLTLDVMERGGGDFDDALAFPTQAARITVGGLLLDASVGFEFRPDLSQSRGLMVGVRAGYTFAPGDWNPQLHGRDDLLNSPDIGIEGFYVHLTLGGWGRGDRADGVGR